MAEEGGKVGSPTHRPPLPPRYTRFGLKLSRPRNHEAGVRVKPIPVVPSEIEPATFRREVQ
jgi:hypothetical protein